MPQPDFSVLVTGFSFLEGPRWHDGRLFLSDFYTHRVIAVDMDGRIETVAEIPQQPSGLGWLPDGRMLVVSMLDRKLLRQEPDGSLVDHADLSGVASNPANDMVVDEHGRAYVGNFGFDLPGGAPLETTRLALAEPDGRVSTVAEGLYFPNGSMITPDGRTLLVNETFGNRISAFDIHSGGTLGPRRDWACFGPLPEGRQLDVVRPQLKVAADGGVLDAEGAVWVADALGKRVLRVAEGGHILDEITTGDFRVFACALGGPGRRTLFLCVAPEVEGHGTAGVSGASVFSLNVAVPGAGFP